MRTKASITKLPAVVSISDATLGFPPQMGPKRVEVDHRPHFPRGSVGRTASSQCLAATYEKDIRICRTIALTDSIFKIDSTEPWLHAMDVETYPQPQEPGIRPQCRTIGCVNYYRNRKDSCVCQFSADDFRRKKLTR